MKEAIKKLWVKYKVYIIVGLILVLGIMLTVQTCKVRRGYDDLSISKGVEKALQKQLEAKDKLLKENEETYEERIGYLNGHLDLDMTVITELNGDIEAEKAKVEDLKNKLAAVPTGDLSAENTILKGINQEQEKLIVKLEEQIAKLGPPRQVELSDGETEIVYPEGSITWSLNQKYLEAMYRGDKWKEGYDDAIVLLGVRAGLIGDLERSLAKKKASANLNKWVSRGLVVALGVALFKK